MPGGNPHSDACRKAFHRRVSAEGLFKEYKKLREQFRRDGHGRDSWLWAAWYFPPKSGAEHELFFGPEFDAMPENPPEPPPPPCGPGGPRAFVKFGKDSKVEQEVVPEWEKFTEAVDESPKRAETRWDKLMLSIPLTRKASFGDSLKWCFDMCGTPLGEIDPDSVPSRGSLFFLKHIGSGGANYSELLRNGMAKFIPTGRDQDAAARFEDDGREILSGLDALDAEFDEGDDVEDAA